MLKNYIPQNWIAEDLNWVDFSDFVLDFKWGPVWAKSDEVALGDDINGTSGNDEIQGTSGNDRIYGLAGNDTIYGNGGFDIIYGGSFADTIYANGSRGEFYGDSGDDIIYGDGSGPQEIYGGNGNDILNGVDGRNKIYGGNGADQLIGGNSLIYNEYDTLYFDEFDTVIDGGLGNSDRAYYDGNQFADLFITDLSMIQNVSSVHLNYHSNNFVDFGGSTHFNAFGLHGGKLRDVITGTHERDEIYGNKGADIIEGRKGDDLLYGGEGSDQLYGNLGNDVLFGEEGSDRLFGGYGDDFLGGGVGDDIFHGESGADRYSGAAGNDRFFGDYEDTYVDGGNDRDIFSMAATSFGITLDARDVETILLSDGDDNLTFTATSAAVIKTFNGDDTIMGSGSAHIYAGQGDDTITSGDGIDFLYFFGRWGDDTITDFNHGLDYIDLTGSSPASMNDLTITQDGADTLIQAHLKSIRLLNTDARFINSGHFLFEDLRTIEGTSGDDVINGTSASEFIYSFGGTDIVYGNGGDDKIFDAEYNSSSFRKNDTLYGGDGNDSLYASAGNDRLFGGNGDDSLQGGTGTNTLDGGNGNDVLIGTGTRDTLIGGAGFDYLYGNGATLYADDDDIFLKGLKLFVQDTSFHHVFNETGFTTVHTTTGNDYVDLSGNNSFRLTLKTFDGDDTIIATNRTDFIYAGRGNDTITTGFSPYYDDIIYFFDSWGDDVITDFISKRDTLDLSGAGVVGLSGLTITQDGLDTLIVNAEGTIRLLNFDKANLRFSDFVFAAAAADQNIMSDETALGDDIDGTDGDDNITGTDNNDRIFGFSGDDVIAGGLGDDFIHGNGDNDILRGGSGNDEIHGGTGNDRLFGNNGDDVLRGGLGDDYLLGDDGHHQGNDTLYGGGGDDLLNGDFGDDTLYGGDDNDRLFGWADNDIIYGESGDDFLHGGSGDDYLDGGDGNDTIYGVTYTGSGDGTDIIYGGNGNDTIYGSYLDTVYGDAGVDQLYGDTLYIDNDDIVVEGKYIFVTSAFINFDYAATRSTSTLSAARNYVILEFNGSSGNDTIDFSTNLGLSLKVLGGAGDDSIMTGARDDRIYGGDGDDIMTSNGGFDIYYFEGSWGQDTITDFVNGGDLLDLRATSIMQFSQLNITQSGSDTLIEALGQSIRLLNTNASLLTGNNFVFNGEVEVTQAGSVVRGTGQDDYLSGDILGNRLWGLGGDDILIGNGAQDKLIGGAGNDILDASLSTNSLLKGGLGSDQLIGGIKNDNMFFDAFDTLIDGGSGGATATYEGTLNFGQTHIWDMSVFANISFLYLGRSHDIIDMTAVSISRSGLTVDIYGGNGNDVFTGSVGLDRFYGENGNDIIYGGDYRDDLYGGNGKDKIWGEAGNDYILGGTGNDFLYGNNGADYISGGGDDDYIAGGKDRDDLRGDSGNDILIGGFGDDYLNGGTENDRLNGGEGNDYLHGGTGADELYGGNGDDILIVDSMDLIVSGGEGFDTVTAIPNQAFIHTFQAVAGAVGNIDFERLELTKNDDVVDISIAGGDRDLEINANQGDDTIISGDGNDIIYGQSGNDTLNGGGGDDIIWGGVGTDVMTGGSGIDSFHFIHSAGHDTVTDFEDQIDKLSINIAGINSISDLTLAQDSADTLITFGNNSIRLLNTDIATIDEMDFVF